MKKVIFSALVLSGGLFACSKADIQNNSNLSSNDVVTTPTKTNGNGTEPEIHRRYQNNGQWPGTIFKCDGAGGRCKADTKVAPSDVAVLSGFTEAGADLVNLFIQNDAMLATYLGASNVLAVITGSLSIEVTGDIQTSAFFVFSEDGNIVNVIPLKK